MADALTEAHLEAQRRLRGAVAAGVTAIWASLPSYNQENVEEFLERALPLVLVGQRKAVQLVDAYLARAMDRQPLGIDHTELVGAAVRNGTEPAEVYRRAFIQTWAALGNGTAWADAVQQGLRRVDETAEMDVQLSQRAALGAAQSADSNIRGYRRHANAGACPFCRKIDGAFVKLATAMPLHPHCGCSLQPIREDTPATPTPEGVAIHEHGELGPLLGDPTHHFTGPAAI